MIYRRKSPSLFRRQLWSLWEVLVPCLVAYGHGKRRTHVSQKYSEFFWLHTHLARIMRSIQSWNETQNTEWERSYWNECIAADASDLYKYLPACPRTYPLRRFASSSSPEMKVSSQFLLLAVTFSPSAFGLVQKPGLQLPPSAAASKQQVKKIFTDAFSAYTKFAFGHDDLTRKLIGICACSTRSDMRCSILQRYPRWDELAFIKRNLSQFTREFNLLSEFHRWAQWLG